MPEEWRDTKYAKELDRASQELEDGEEARIERLKIKQGASVVIRFSWWKDGEMIPRPLDLSEEDLMELLAKGVPARADEMNGWRVA